MTVASQFSPQFPPQRADVSLGLPQGFSQTTAVGAGAAVRLLVPSGENGGSTMGMEWTSVELDDSAWTEGTSGVGYEATSGFGVLIATDIESEMAGINATAYVRTAFHVDNPTSVFSLVLRMKYDDGYVAYLNGVEVVRRNAPDELRWDSAATATHRNNLAVEFEDVDISAHIDRLLPGRNILAIHGLNSSAASNDFLVLPELVVTYPAVLVGGTMRYFQTPTPGCP